LEFELKMKKILKKESMMKMKESLDIGIGLEPNDKDERGDINGSLLEELKE
jgi:hypothetical protein